MDWRYCRTDDFENDFEVTGTHIGLVYNPSVYSIIATRHESFCRPGHNGSSLLRCGFLAVCLNVVRSIVVPRDSKKMFVQLSSRAIPLS